MTEIEFGVPFTDITIYIRIERKCVQHRLLEGVVSNYLVLFVKADEAKALIESIKQNGKLYVGAESALFVNSMKMWVGTEQQYNVSNLRKEFEREECKDSFATEYDYVAMRFLLSKSYTGWRNGDDSYERNKFFTEICKEEVPLLECSNRLSFQTNNTTEVYDVY